MNFFKIPTWIDKNLLQYSSLEEIPDSEILSIRDRLAMKVSKAPLVTIIIAAWNEEVNLIWCLETLSKNETSIPFDIIVINNNSSDRTQQVINKLGVESYFQPIQGCGPAREMGQQKAKGKYILVADADCFYPKKWIDIMTNKLQQNGVVFVYGRYSFLGTSVIPRWKFFFYEIIRDFIIEVRHFKRPYLSAYGISMGYIKEYGLKEGYLTRNIRGDDGRLCFDLMKYGKVSLVRASGSRVWTGNRTLKKEGGLYTSFKHRVLREIALFDRYFKDPIPHDTKISENNEITTEQSIEIIRKKYNPLRLFKRKK